MAEFNYCVANLSDSTKKPRNIEYLEIRHEIEGSIIKNRTKGVETSKLSNDNKKYRYIKFSWGYPFYSVIQLAFAYFYKRILSSIPGIHVFKNVIKKL
jgi:hypothetical protein